MRLSGTFFSIEAIPRLASSLFAVISLISGVLVIPGHTVLTVIWLRANSRASVFENAINPPLVPE